jgi:hypothetical protein
MMFAFRREPQLVENACILIHQSPAVVFHFLGDRFFTNYPRWSPEVCELKQLDSGPVRVGTRALQVRNDLGHRSESLFAVTVFEPGRKVTFEGISSPFRCDYELEALTSSSATQLRFTFALATLDLYLKPFEGVIRKAVRSGVERTVRTLGSLVEGENPRARQPVDPTNA